MLPMPTLPEAYSAKLEAARAQQSGEAERRVITILFCDVAGSTAMASQLDPEEWAEIMAEAFDYLIAPIYRYEGFVARLMGDAVLAFFGAPIAHEDDPERAVRAGLDMLAEIQSFREEIRRDYGLDFNVRVGLNTGPVVVGAMGSDLALEYTAMGDAINLAARMEQTAQPGTVRISKYTQRLVAPLFDLEPLGAIEVKGKEEPVEAFRVIGTKAEPGRLRGIEGLSAPLTGRSAEFDRLRESAARVRQGRGQIVCLLGEAGLGKSRLIDELRGEWLADQAAAGLKPRWVSMAAVSYEANRPYGMVKHLIRTFAGIDEHDPADMIRAKLARTLQQVPEPTRSRKQSVFELLLALQGNGSTGTAPEGESFQRELSALIMESLRALIANQPVVFATDDIHWADPASVEVFRQLLRLADTEPVLFLFAFRPYRQTPGWQIKLDAETDYPHRYIEIQLHPLTAADSDALVDSLLAVAELPAKLRALILQKAEGNPFFVEEVIRSLIESGAIVRDASGLRWEAASTAPAVELPDTLLALLQARIDRLEQEARRVLQLAAVIGRTFYYRVLQEVTQTPALEGQLNALQRAELIREQARQPELTYLFQHELTRDAAYNSVLRRQRRRFHRRVAEAMERLFADRLAEEAHRLAYHFEAAGDDAATVKYATLAGDAAARLHASAEALVQYTRALEAAKRGGASDEQLIHLYEGRGRAMELQSQYEAAMANYEELEQLAETRDSSQMLLAALLAQGLLRCTATELFDPQHGESLARRASALAQELDDRAAEATALWLLLNVYRLTGRNLAALEAGERSVALMRELAPRPETGPALRQQLAHSMHDLTHVHQAVGNLQRAAALLDEATSLWRELNNQPMLADSLATGVLYPLLAGDYERAIALSNEAFEISKNIDNLWGQSYSRMVIGAAYRDLGQFDQAIEISQLAVELGRRSGFPVPQLFGPGFVATIYAEVGDYERATDILRQVVEEAQGPFAHLATGASVALADVRLLTGDVSGAAALLDEIDEEGVASDLWLGGLAPVRLALARNELQRALQKVEERANFYQSQGRDIYVPPLLILKGQTLAGQGDDEAAYATLSEARAMAGAMKQRRTLWRILAALADLEAKQGDHETAAALRDEARTIVDYIADHVSTAAARESFLQLAQEVLDELP